MVSKYTLCFPVKPVPWAGIDVTSLIHTHCPLRTTTPCAGETGDTTGEVDEGKIMGLYGNQANAIL